MNDKVGSRWIVPWTEAVDHKNRRRVLRKSSVCGAAFAQRLGTSLARRNQ